MENKNLFQVSTAWTFPVLQYTTNISYVEVKKASGIAYILLQLINSLKNNPENLTATLKAFGVPGDIHHIFANELANMISYGIIRMKSGQQYGSDLIDTYRISDFEITDLGKKLFAEGTISTGTTNIKKIQLYYDISQKDILIEKKWKLFRLEDSTLDENCIGEIILNDSDVEAFIYENLDRLTFRKGERISEFNHEKPEVLVYKLDDAVTINISSKNMSIRAKDKDRDLFIHETYSADIISKILQAKKKYQFPEYLKSEVREYEYENISNIVKVYMPSQSAVAMKVKSPLAFGKICEINGSQSLIDGDFSFKLMENCNIPGSAAYFENKNLYAVIPGSFLIHVEGYTDKCTINLVVVQQLEENVKQELMNALFFMCLETDNSLANYEIIIQLTKISGCKDYLEQFANFRLKKVNDNVNKIDYFLKLNDQFLQIPEWHSFSQNTAEILLENLCGEITVEKFKVQDKLGRKLKEIIGCSDIEYLKKMSEKLVSENGKIIAYETMEDAGYGADILLNVVNVFEVYCDKILESEHINGNSKMSSQCALVGQSLSELRKITGIHYPAKDAAELDFDNERFIKVMATFSDSLKKMERYKIYAIKQYKELASFYERFVELKEVATIEKEAAKNPRNINSAYINQRLKKARYKDAICDLHIRLQFELNRLFATENMSTYDLLTNSGISQYLTDKEIEDMHELRKCRNGFQHPKEKRNVQYSESRIKGWCAIVEKLGGIDHESRSTN